MANMIWFYLKTNPQKLYFLRQERETIYENKYLFNNYFTRIRRSIGKSISCDALWHPKTMKYPSTNYKHSQERLPMTLSHSLKPKKDKKNTKNGYSRKRTLRRLHKKTRQGAINSLPWNVTSYICQSYCWNSDKHRKRQIRTRLQQGEGSDYLRLVQVTGLEPAWNCFHMDLMVRPCRWRSIFLIVMRFVGSIIA